MRRLPVLILVMLLVGFNTLFLDLAWWHGPLCRIWSWLNRWYHILVYTPSIVAPLLVIAACVGLGFASAMLYTIAGFLFATWVNDFLWWLLLGRPEKLAENMVDWSWRTWNVLHFGFKLYIPHWLFALSLIIRPLLVLLLLWCVEKEGLGRV